MDVVLRVLRTFPADGELPESYGHTEGVLVSLYAVRERSATARAQVGVGTPWATSWACDPARLKAQGNQQVWGPGSLSVSQPFSAAVASLGHILSHGLAPGGSRLTFRGLATPEQP